MRPEDEQDFAELVRALSPRLHRMAYAVCGDSGLAEDAVQATLIAAYRSWPRVRAAGKPEAYVRKMVLNQLMSWRRRKSWAMPARTTLIEPSHDSHEGDVVDHELVWSAVGLLPPRQRAVIVLRYYEGMSEAAIAETLGIRPGTVKSQASAAMAHLRLALADTESAPAVADRTNGVR